MSETPLDSSGRLHWHPEASEEFVRQLARVEQVLKQLAEDAGTSAPLPPPHVPHDVVYRPHVLTATERLLAPAASVSPEPVSSQRFVFISYSHEDVEFIRELSRDIKAAGIPCFLDERSIRTGAQWAEVLRESVRRCTVFLTVLTPRSLTSDWCKMEAGAAWALGKRIVAILRYARPGDLPGPLKELQAMTVETREQQAELVSELQSLVDGGESTTGLNNSQENRE